MYIKGAVNKSTGRELYLAVLYCGMLPQKQPNTHVSPRGGL